MAWQESIVTKHERHKYESVCIFLQWLSDKYDTWVQEWQKAYILFLNKVYAIGMETALFWIKSAQLQCDQDYVCHFKMESY